MKAPVQYGPRLAAAVAYLQCSHFLAERRLAQLPGNQFKVHLSAAGSAAITAAVGVTHLDETGLRIAGRGQWLYDLSTRWMTFYRTSERRGQGDAGYSGARMPGFVLPAIRGDACTIQRADFAGAADASQIRLGRLGGTRVVVAAVGLRGSTGASRQSWGSRYRARCWSASGGASTG